MISTVIIAKNEEKHIAACIQSVSFTDEIIVIDNGSSDKTTDIAQHLSARVIDMSDIQDFSKLRTRGIEEAQNNWILFVDADEILSTELQSSIIKEIQNPKYVIYYLKRRDHWWGRVLRYGEIQSAYSKGFIRFIRRGTGQWSGAVHEVYKTSKKAGHLSGFIDHYPHVTLHEFVDKINIYSSLRAKELHVYGSSSTILEILFMPFLKFVYTYGVCLGFLDGPSGFVYSFLMSFHSFLVRAKLYMMKS
ncbi:MAG: Glycosyltransferase involved in cell wall biogenesis [Candidatus Roizmanbacteria bacterium GW2011_GWA2_37_7]|uniref:Glycosyltransferase involved in cell wall biogenesis n=1 Tax=Candidatus Roizmanbacteria bacterium GW2011_GWA2_37_7 TaxID=1618481 RepID=A0A0G0HD04_9BACT|nr:MAG: Glycosyltransferase involved in cell wall biogenesis [Candidatus Roizmanbacteria bacterium GW2011_GWA2_37_7]